MIFGVHIVIFIRGCLDQPARMICFVRRRFGWVNVPEDVGNWLVGCDEIANMCQSGAVTFQEEDMKIFYESFTYAVSFNVDGSVKSKMLWFGSGEKCEVVMSENGKKPVYHGGWEGPRGGVVLDMTDEV